MMNGFSPAWSPVARCAFHLAWTRSTLASLRDASCGAEARVQLSLGPPARYAAVCACGTDTRCKTREHYMIAVWTRLP
jgi:hypothetical protein